MDYGWTRRVATLAARVALGVETFEDIARTPTLHGTPLLWPQEVAMLKKVLFLQCLPTEELPND